MTQEEEPAPSELYKAIQLKNIDRAKLLLEQGADPNERRNSDPLLHYAITCDKSGEFVKLLVGYGAELDAINNNGLTALMYAACYRNTPALNFLIERGAALDKIDRFGRTALNIASGEIYWVQGANMIKDAAILRQQAEEARLAAYHKTAVTRQDILKNLRPKITVRPS